MINKYFSRMDVDKALEEFNKFLSIRQIWAIKGSDQDFYIIQDDKDRVFVRFLDDEG